MRPRYSHSIRTMLKIVSQRHNKQNKISQAFLNQKQSSDHKSHSETKFQLEVT